MSDGVNLVGDVVSPTDPATGMLATGPFPVLLVQTPYQCETTQGPTTLSANILGGWDYWAQRGYVFASFCVRGTGRSAGEYGAFSPRDQQDGVELVDWAAHDAAHANGEVGLIGCSYMGLVQLFTAAALGPGSPVKAMSPSCAGADVFRMLTFGGVPTESQEYLAPFAAILLGPRAQVVGLELATSMQTGGEYAFDTAYWQARRPGNLVDEIVASRIPTLLWSGWDDVFGQGAIEMYTYLQNAAAGRTIDAPIPPGRPADPRYQLIMGPWGHGGGIEPERLLDWFDLWLKHTDNPIRTSDTPLHLRERRSGRWINTTTWPPVQHYTKLYLAGDGRLQPDAPAGGTATIRYTDPSAPGGSLQFTSDPIKAGATVIGPVAARMTVSSTSRDAHLIADLEDVAPDGKITEITHGNLIASQRALKPEATWTDANGTITRPWGTYDEAELLDPGTPVRLDIMLRPTAYSLAPGHRLRLLIRTQFPPRSCAALLGTRPCFPQLQQRVNALGTYTIRLGSGSDTSIALPLAAENCFRASGGTGEQPHSLRDPDFSCLDPGVPAGKRLGLPTGSRCRARLGFRPRSPSGSSLRSLRVLVNGRSKVVRRGRDLLATIKLTGLRKHGANKVVAIGRTTRGRRVTSKVTYRPCATRR